MTHEPGSPGPIGPGPADERVPDLLRRAGTVEQAPHPRVWRSLTAALALTTLADRRRSVRSPGPLPLLAAAAAGALLTWLGAGLVDRDTPEQVVASGSLAPLVTGAPGGTDGQAGSWGTARVVDVDGEHVLRVELDDVPDAGEGYLEVWLLRPDVSGMVTLGVLDGATAQFALPAGLDLSDYPVVDISRERLDGDPAHGGDSLVRGEVG